MALWMCLLRIQDAAGHGPSPGRAYSGARKDFADTLECTQVGS